MNPCLKTTLSQQLKAKLLWVTQGREAQVLFSQAPLQHHLVASKHLGKSQAPKAASESPWL